MMEQTRKRVGERRVGETAVDGLLAGLAAGAVMLGVLVVAGWLVGLGPAVTVGRFDPAPAGRWLPGLTTHLAVSAVYGLLFALVVAGVVRLRPALARWTWLLGLGYGLLLWGMAQGFLLPGVGSPLLAIGALQMAPAHAVYGLLLGVLLARG